MWEYIKLHIGKFIAVIAGLFFSLIYLFSGLLDAIVVFIIMSIAFYIGFKKDKKESIRDALKQVLPDNFFDRDHH